MIARLRVVSVLWALLVPSIALCRVWTDTHGNTITATFVRLHGDVVVLSQAGRVIQVPLANLSRKDQAYVRQRSGGEGGGVPDISARLSRPVKEQTGEGRQPAGEPQGTGGGTKSEGPSGIGGTPEPVRVWTDVRGNTLNAQFIGVTHNQVILKVGDQQKQFPYGGFSQKDQAYIRSVLQKRGQGQLIPRVRPGGPGMSLPGGYGSREGPDGQEYGDEEYMEQYGSGYPGSESGEEEEPDEDEHQFTSGYPEGGMEGGGEGFDEGEEDDEEYMSGYPDDAMEEEGEGSDEEDDEGYMSGYSGVEGGENGYGSEGGYGSPGSGPPPMASGPMGNAAPPGPGGGPRPEQPLPGSPRGGPSGHFGGGPSPGPNDVASYKQCANCKKILPPTIQVGDRCPYCNVKFEFEEGLDGKLRDAEGREVSKGELAARRIGIGAVSFFLIAAFFGILRAMRR